MILTNQLKKYIKSLYLSKYRQKYNKFIAEGPKICGEFIAHQTHNIEYAVVTESWIAEHESAYKKLSGKTLKCKEKDLQSISNHGTANKILIVVNQSLAPVTKDDLQGQWTVYLDELRDPGNLGTIIRICDWFAIPHVIASPNSVDFYNPKVVQSAMGSHNRVALSVKDHQELSKLQIPLYAMVMDGQEISNDLHLPPGAIIIGNESKGVSEPLKNISAKTLTIPRLGHAESLNAAIALAVTAQVLVGS